MPWSVCEFDPDPGAGLGVDVAAGVDVGAVVVVGAGVPVMPPVGGAVGALVWMMFGALEGVEVAVGIGDDCADATPADASASAAVGSISRVVWCMLGSSYYDGGWSVRSRVTTLNRFRRVLALAYDLVHRPKEAFDLFIRGVEVGAHAKAAARAVVHEDAPRDELMQHALGVRDVDAHPARAPRRVVRCVHRPAAFERRLGQARRQANVVLADPGDADLADDVVAGFCDQVAGDRRRAGRPAQLVGRVVDGRWLERERVAVREPAGDHRREALRE